MAQANTGRQTYYVVQSFSKQGRTLRMDAPVQAQSEASARRMAERLAPRKQSVVAFARSGDPATGEFEDPVVLVSYGDNGQDEELPF